MITKNILSRKVVTIDAEDTVMLAAERMQDKMVGSLVVLDGDKPAGIITDRDITLRVVATGKSHQTPVKEIMTRNPVTINEDATLFELTKLFRKSGVRRIIVVNKEGALAGIISIDDVLELLATEFANMITAIRGYS